MRRVDLVVDRDLIVVPNRSGGPFDPAGARWQDVVRADQLITIVDAHGGRWVMVTLTVDRAQFLGPEHAYAICNERVREVARAVSLQKIHATALELQGLTGDGWPHWHLIFWAPDARSVEVIKQKVLKVWRTRHDRVDEVTGEVLGHYYLPIAQPQCIDVQEAQNRHGVARYAAKYLFKEFTVPPWLGESRRQLRKMRLSDACFTALARMGLHIRHRGGRKVPTLRRPPSRPVFDRMARSLTSHAVLRKEGDRLRYVASLPVVADYEGAAVLRQHGAVCLREGPWSKVVWRISPAAVEALRRRSDLAERQRRERQRRRAELESLWDRVQRARQAERAGE